MAIARDASGQIALGASPRAQNHTCTGSDRILFVGTKGASGYSTGTTYNGVPMTRLHDVQSGVGEYHLSLFSLIAPSTGTNTVSTTVASGNIGFTSSSYTGANQTTQPDVSTTNVGASGTSLTTAVTTTTDNAWLIGYFNSAANTLTQSTGTNFVQTQANNVALGDSNGAYSPAGSYSMRVTSGSGTFGAIVAGIRDAASGPSTTIKTYLGTATASVKTVLNGTAIASRKTWNGIA